MKNFVFNHFSYDREKYNGLCKFYGQSIGMVYQMNMTKLRGSWSFFVSVITRGANANKPEKFRVDFIKKLAKADTALGYVTKYLVYIKVPTKKGLEKCFVFFIKFYILLEKNCFYCNMF